MRNLQFNHSIDGSITIRVDDTNVGYIDASDKPIVKVVLFFEGDNQTEYYNDLNTARKDISAYFAAKDVYEF